MEELGRILALDVGDVRTGVAVCDPTRTIVSPHAVVKEPSREKALAALCAIIDAVEPVLVVAGLPLLENGDEGPQARRVRAFIALLETRIGVPVVFEDERYTTLAVHAEPFPGHGLYRLNDKMHQVILRNPVPEVRRQQQRLITVGRYESCAHGTEYSGI